MDAICISKCSKDPTLSANYRGTSLTSSLSKFWKGLFLPLGAITSLQVIYNLASNLAAPLPCVLMS